MILKIHKNWTILFKQRLKTTQQQLDKRDAFSKEIKKTLWTPKPNCEKGLNTEDKKFLENMKGGRKGGVSSLDSITVAKNKQTIEKLLQLKKRKFNEEQRKIDCVIKSFIIADRKKTVKIVHQVMLVKRTLTFIYLKHLTKERNNCKKSGLLLV